MKLVKMIERGKRTMDNNIFERDQKNFFTRIEGSTEYEGAMPEMDKFVKISGKKMTVHLICHGWRSSRRKLLA